MVKQKKQKQAVRRWAKELRGHAREKPSVVIAYLVLRIIVIVVAVRTAINGDFESTFICLLVLVLFLIPAFLQERFSVELPSTLEIIILLLIFAAEIMGELSNYYIRVTYWDTLLHTTWGFLLAAVGFSLVDVLNRSESIRVQLSSLYLAIGAFCFSMTIGVLWEFLEFCADYFLHLDMQKDTVIHAFSSVTLDPTMQNVAVRVENITDVAVNGESLGLGGYLDIGLYDTMEDLFVNFIGALIFSIIGYFAEKSHGRNWLAASFIPRFHRHAEQSAADGEDEIS
ncbi:MAG: hypothetical protein LUG25_00090 [Oscillospiraceae bacterium]|nr:hypothetical protein [Oscillospiraceae bacterium]